jgi:hypothetical protein
MNVSIQGLGSGNVVTFLRPNAGGEKPQGAPPADTRTDGVVTKVETDASRRAWFDFNGDGRIEDRSSMYGGDGVVIVSKNITRLDRARSRQVEDPVGVPAPSEKDTPVAVEQARDAYLRYGQGNEQTNNQHAVAAVA